MSICPNCKHESKKNREFCPRCGFKFKKAHYQKQITNITRIMLIITVVVFAFLVGFFCLTKIIFNNHWQQPKSNQIDDSLVESITVSISCLDKRTNEWIINSGIVVNSSGLILASVNNVPHRDQHLYLASSGCLIGFAESKTGRVQTTYWAQPVANILYTHQAFVLLQIYGKYYQNGIKRLTNPHFASLADMCINEDLSLGDKIKIYNYIGESANSGLTVIDGIVSNMSVPNLIFTTAQTNSFGGLVVDDNNCAVGVTDGYMSPGDQWQNLSAMIPIHAVNGYLQSAGVDLKGNR